MQCGVAVEDQERNDLVQMTLQVGLCRLYAGLILSAQEYENFIGIIENNRCAQVW